MIYLGNLAELMTDYDKATSCYESALRHNPYSVPALTQIASLCRGREQFGRVGKKDHISDLSLLLCMYVVVGC